GARGGKGGRGAGRGRGGGGAKRARAPARFCLPLKKGPERTLGERWSWLIVAKAGHNDPPFERIVRWSPRHCRDVLWGSRSLLGKNICSTSLWMRTSHASARAARSRKCAASASASLTPFFGCPKLKRKFMSKVHGPFAVFVRHVRGLLQQGYDRAPGVIGYAIGILLSFGRRRKRDNGTCFVGSIIRTHRTHSAP